MTQLSLGDFQPSGSFVVHHEEYRIKHATCKNKCSSVTVGIVSFHTILEFSNRHSETEKVDLTQIYKEIIESL